MFNSKNIYLDPVLKYTKIINSSNNNTIFLVGPRNSGKSTVLNKYIEKSNSIENPVVDITTRFSEYFIISDLEVYKIYYTCLVVKKMIDYISNNYESSNEVNIYNSYVDNLIKNIAYLYFIGDYSSKCELFESNLLNNPKSLLDNFIKILKVNYKVDNITYVLDNFDVVGESSERYQKCMFDLLKDKKKIISISDNNIFNNYSRLNTIGDVVKLDYSQDLEVVKEILDKHITEEYLKKGLISFKKRIRFILSDYTIKEMINNTNGNINDMKKSINILYNNIEYLSKEEYADFLICTVNDINNHSRVSIIPRKERVLKI